MFRVPQARPSADSQPRSQPRKWLFPGDRSSHARKNSRESPNKWPVTKGISSTEARAISTELFKEDSIRQTEMRQGTFVSRAFINRVFRVDVLLLLIARCKRRTYLKLNLPQLIHAIYMQPYQWISSSVKHHLGNRTTSSALLSMRPFYPGRTTCGRRSALVR